MSDSLKSVHDFTSEQVKTLGLANNLSQPVEHGNEITALNRKLFIEK